ncbi:Sua5/YciO/YrdC/YwlC family protein [Symplocastrum sp. BBK-W-15]|uniref:Sua5/YciO/YrdC/YwlC family protein n=1 Tax=Limnofasciculus baicalensis BBK-W-15 TaxID=2699891 RepID=A0AAE3GXF3_9CYAN|nr:Sua5/YciO/YrdC/YwlC family protein [Limnofasciculus baicalensis]MCP2732370.1 Sua5/YciO/YrdC/YwlC family protein [Limnofasciculus baicalensis BBK-W-15]
MPTDDSPSDTIDIVCTLLKQGKIVAIKGLGGIHLACDATNETAVQKLRSRKQRYYDQNFGNDREKSQGKTLKKLHKNSINNQ